MIAWADCCLYVFVNLYVVVGSSDMLQGGAVPFKIMDKEPLRIAISLQIVPPM